MSCFLFFLFVGIELSLGMNCNDGIHAHFKVVNNDFIDICNRVNIKAINGNISDNIINDKILRIQNPFYLIFDEIPIYPLQVGPLSVGIHIQAHTQAYPNDPTLPPLPSYNNRYVYTPNCILGTTQWTVDRGTYHGKNDNMLNGYKCFVMNPTDGSLTFNGAVYGVYGTTITSDPSFVNWTLYYSNEYKSQSFSYFKNNAYVKTTGFGLNFLNMIGGSYTANARWDYDNDYCLYDTIFIKNIIISNTSTSNFYGFQNYILGNNIQPLTPTNKPIQNIYNPTINPTIKHTNKASESFYDMDNIYQNLFYGLLGLIVGILLTILCNICIKKRNKKQIRNEISKNRLLSNDNNNNNRTSINN